MGYGAYSYSDRMTRATTDGLTTRPASEIFSRTFNSSMNPNGVTIRESRDCVEHPESVPIILGLDVTGSMGRIPHFLVREGLPSIVDQIIREGIADPQVLFMGIGDHECDRAPLQIGQFESSDSLMDRWLTELWIESGGGGNYGESYLLAWLFASRYTQTDHFDQREQKGLLFTVGDEPTLRDLPVAAQQAIFGPGQYEAQTAASLLAAAREKFEVFHLHMLQGHNGGRGNVQEGWRELMGEDNVLLVQNQDQVVSLITSKVLEIAEAQGVGTAPPESDTRFDHLDE